MSAQLKRQSSVRVVRLFFVSLSLHYQLLLVLILWKFRCVFSNYSLIVLRKPSSPFSEHSITPACMSTEKFLQ